MTLGINGCEARKPAGKNCGPRTFYYTIIRGPQRRQEEYPRREYLAPILDRGFRNEELRVIGLKTEL